MASKLAIIGYGELPTGWFPEKSTVDMAIEVAKETILDAGIDKDEIGALLQIPVLAQELEDFQLTFGRLIDELGLRGVKFNLHTNGGGTSTMMAFKTARGMIDSGTAEIVLIVHAQNWSRVPPEEMRRFFFVNSGEYEEWEFSYGRSYNSMVAQIAQRYIYETGLTPEQLASAAVTLRRWAQLNPRAAFRKPMTLEDVLNSRMISTPLHALECNVLRDGAAAFIVTSAEKAKSIAKKPPVYILGEGHGGFSHFSITQKPDKDFTGFGFGRAAEIALEEAGIKLEEVDVPEIYGSYPILDLILLEEIGFCKRGEGGELFMEGYFAPGGKLPVSTNGEIQQGHCGAGVGMAIFTEAVRQLRGEAGERQVKDAKIALVTDAGGQIMDSHVSILGKELS